MSQQANTASAEWRAHWPKVTAAMIGMSFYAMLTYHFGLFIEPLQKEFGWSRASISLGLTVYTVGAVIVGPFVGAMVDKTGSRLIAIAGLITSGVALAGMSFLNSLTYWYLLWAVISVTALGVKSTVWSAGISSLFTAGRGLAIALVLCGTAIAQTLAPLLSNALIADRGWRESYLWLGLGWSAVCLLATLLFFFDAHDQKKRAGAAAMPLSALGGLTVQEALRSMPIIKIALANLFMAIVGGGVSVHLVPLLSATGAERSTAAAIAATAGIAGIAGKLITGWLLDRFQGNLVPFTSTAIAAIGYLLLLNTLHSPTALTAGVMFLGYAAGAGLQVSAYLISRYGGLRNYGKIYATIGSMMMLGTSVGPWLAGTVFDKTGSYNGLLLAAAPVVFISALLYVGLGPYPVFAEDAGKRAEPGSA